MTIQTIHPAKTPAAEQNSSGEALPSGNLFDMIQQSIAQSADAQNAQNEAPLNNAPAKTAKKKPTALDAMPQNLIDPQLLADLMAAATQIPMNAAHHPTQAAPAKPNKTATSAAVQSSQPVSQSLPAEKNIPQQLIAAMNQLSAVKSTRTSAIPDAATAALEIAAKENHIANPLLTLQSGEAVLPTATDTNPLPPTLEMNLDALHKSAQQNIVHAALPTTTAASQPNLLAASSPLMNTMKEALSTATPPKAAAVEDTSSKALDAMNQLGNIIQNQISAALPQLSLPNHTAAPAADTSSPASFKESLDLIAQNGSAAHLDLSADSAVTNAKEAYEANIKIYPPELGNVTAKLKMDNNSAQLVILTENNQVKSIVEANLPQLKEHFSQSQINLTHVEVQTASSGGNGNQGQYMSKKSSSDEFTQNQFLGNENPAAPGKESTKTNDKIVDTYA